MAKYFGFEMLDSMFPDESTLRKMSLSPRELENHLKSGAIPCFPPSYNPTIEVLKNRFGIELEIQKREPLELLKPGDSLIVISVRGLSSVEDRDKYTDDEAKGATFTFSIWSVQ